MNNFSKTIPSFIAASHIHEPKVHHKESWLGKFLDFATGSKIYVSMTRNNSDILPEDVYTGRVNGKATKDTGRISQRSHDLIDFS